MAKSTPPSPSDIGGALGYVRESINTGRMSLAAVLEKTPDIALTVKVPALYALVLETYCEEHGITRHDLTQRLLMEAINRMADTQIVPDRIKGAA